MARACLVIAGGIEEPEDSPLFAQSMQRAFEGLASRNAVLPGTAGGLGAAPFDPGSVILVEGTHWRTLPAKSGRTRPAGGSARKGPIPMATTDFTCGTPTCVGATCENTCGNNITCLGAPWATCYAGSPTCSPGGTCSATCSSSTCGPTACQLPTCSFTCGTTCGTTCGSTCMPSQCQTNLCVVSVPQAGCIQVSFYSSSVLQYTLEYCTNLTADQWTTAASTNGNGGQIVLSHTSHADQSFYRLWIQTQ